MFRTGTLPSPNPGTPGEGKRVAWIIARQHPGETMAEWAAEGAEGGEIDWWRRGCCEMRFPSRITPIHSS